VSLSGVTTIMAITNAASMAKKLVNAPPDQKG